MKIKTLTQFRTALEDSSAIIKNKVRADIEPDHEDWESIVVRLRDALEFAEEQRRSSLRIDGAPRMSAPKGACQVVWQNKGDIGPAFFRLRGGTRIHIDSKGTWYPKTMIENYARNLGLPFREE